MKWAFGILLVVALVATGVGIFLWIRPPKTPQAAYEKASKLETKLDEEIADALKAAPPKTELVELWENRIRDAWQEVVDGWPDSPEAAKAAYRLFEREFAEIAEAEAKIDAIDEFRKEYPEHEKIKELIWRKAEILQDEAKDPLGAIEVYAEIEAEYPEDPLAPKAALARAKIYESIREFGAAADAYRKVAEKYPESSEAAQAEMRRAALLEEKLDRKREAAETYKRISVSRAGSSMGREAGRRRKKLMGDLEESEQDEYYKKTYQIVERDPYEITKEELNSPTRLRIRNQGFDIEHFKIDVAIQPESSYIEATAEVRGTLVKKADQALVFQLSPALDVSKVTLGDGGEGDDLNFSQRGPFIEVALGDHAPEVPATINLRFDYKGELGTMIWDTMTTGGASLRSESSWHPKTEFGDMFTQEVTVACPEEYDALAQGLRVEAEDDWTSQGWKRARFRQERPTGFVTIALGRYESIRFEGPHGMPMEVHLHPSHADEIEPIREAMILAVNTYEEMLGEFPYDRLAVAEVPDFPGGYGAASLILVGSIAFTEQGGGTPLKFLAHEIAHQWFGNMLGLDLMGDSIPWLSEGFATYFDAVFTERTVGRNAFLTQVHTMGNFYRENVLLYEDRPISKTLFRSPMYRSLMYEKGALVLHGLRRELGDENFFRLMREYVADHPYEVVSVQSFSRKASEIAGEPMEWFFEQMLDRTGYARVAILEATTEQTASGWELAITLGQDAPPYRLNLDLGITLPDEGMHMATVDLATTGTSLTVPLKARPLKVRLDPDAWYLLDAHSELVEKELK